MPTIITEEDLKISSMVTDLMIFYPFFIYLFEKLLTNESIINRYNIDDYCCLSKEFVAILDATLEAEKITSWIGLMNPVKSIINCNKPIDNLVDQISNLYGLRSLQEYKNFMESQFNDYCDEKNIPQNPTYSYFKASLTKIFNFW